MQNTIELSVKEVRETNVAFLRKLEAIAEETRVAIKLNDTVSKLTRLNDNEMFDELYTIVFDYDLNMVSVVEYNSDTYSYDSVVYLGKYAAETALDTLLRNYYWTTNRFEFAVTKSGYKAAR